VVLDCCYEEEKWFTVDAPFATKPCDRSAFAVHWGQWFAA